jgi:hypothetical protein
MEGDVKTGNFIEIIEFEDGTKYKKQYENFILILESYFKNEILHRDNEQDFEDSKNEQQFFVLFIYPSSVLTITLRFYVCALFEIHSLYYV